MSASPSLLDEYRKSHQNPVNRWLHSFGIPLIVLSLGLLFYSWRLGSAVFVVGWALQFLGHAFEGRAPSFFRNPLFLFTGVKWWTQKLLRRE
jgi:uncharacterized membrane protein YGL010W